MNAKMVGIEKRIIVERVIYSAIFAAMICSTVYLATSTEMLTLVNGSLAVAGLLTLSISLWHDKSNLRAAPMSILKFLDRLERIDRLTLENPGAMREAPRDPFADVMSRVEHILHPKPSVKHAPQPKHVKLEIQSELAQKLKLLPPEDRIKQLMKYASTIHKQSSSNGHASV
jgi:hypothetical protein